MKMEKFLFAMLLLALLLLEFSVFAYLSSDNNWYIASAAVSTAAACLLSCLLYEIAHLKAPQTKQDYYFYFTDKQDFQKEPFFYLPAVKRK